MNSNKTRIKLANTYCLLFTMLSIVEGRLFSMYFNNPFLNQNGYSSYPQNPYQQILQQNQPQGTALTRVTGMDGAKAYQMPANSTAALFDANEDIMYIKSTDGAGFPTIRVFSFTEVRPEQAAAPAGDYISRQEFEAFKQEVLSNGKQLIQSQPAAGNKQKSNPAGYGNSEGQEPAAGVF